MKDNKHIQSFNEHQENLNISNVNESKKTLLDDDKKKLYLEILGKSTEFTKRAGECLRYTKSEIKNTNFNEIFVKLKEKKKEIEDLISDFEVILKDAKRTK